MRFSTAPALALILATVAPAARADLVTTTTFESVVIPSNPGYINNSDPVGDTNPGFNVDGNVFSNSFDTKWGSWSGWALSNKIDVVDPKAPDYTYQYSAIAGGGAGGSTNYAVAFGGAYINVAAGRSVVSMDVTNTTYDFLSMSNGDQFAKKFGTGDFFTLHVTGHDGLNGAGAATGQVDFNLADFLGGNSTIVDTWKTVDLTSLGSARSLGFSFSSSDNGDYGMNTPAYVAVDNFRTSAPSAPVAVPEPASLATAAVGLFVVAVAARRGRKREAD